MSIKIMSQVWEHSQQRGAKLLLLLAIADFANEDGEAWPGIKTLMAKCRCHKRAVQESIYALRDSGELLVRPREDPIGGYYFKILLIQSAETCALNTKAQKPAHPKSAETCAEQAQKPAPLHNEPSVEPSLQTTTPCTPTPKPAPPYTPEFLKFWKAYPRRVGKGAAFEVWEGKEHPEVAVVIAAVKAQAKSDQWTKEGGKFVPHPRTWLSQRRWDDDVEPDKTTKTDYDKGF